MKKFNELPIGERNEITELFATWLKPYTHEIIVKVLASADEIISNDFAMNLLKELYKREQQEFKSFSDNIYFMLADYENFTMYDSHNDPLSHADSYRQVLADLYIHERG